MADIDMSKVTPELLRKAAACKSADELMELAKSEGFTITKEEAEAYLEDLSSVQLDLDTMNQIAGGIKTCYIVDKSCAWASY